MEAFEKEGGRVRTKRTWLFSLAIAFTVAGFAPALISAFEAVHGSSLLWLVVACYYGGVAGLGHAWNRYWLDRSGRVRADERGLWLGDRCVVARGAVRHGYVLEHEGRTYVRLGGRMVRLVEVEVADAAEGEALLAAMRLDAGRSVAQYPMTHGTWRGSLIRAAITTLGCFASIVAALFLLVDANNPVAALATALAAVMAIYAYALNQNTRVSVGADGIRVRRLLERSRFIPFSAIDDAETDGRDISIRLHDGEVVTLHHPGGRSWKPGALSDRALEGRKLVDRIKEQLAAHRERESNGAPVFTRAGRETDAWLRDVVAAADVNASYRSPAVPPDELWRIVEDVAAPATARAGAAVALRQALDDSGRIRLSAVADACAAPRLRVALETVASSEDDASLAGALDPLDDEPALARRSVRG